jgi:uncharacterized membrane protein YqjE
MPEGAPPGSGLRHALQQVGSSLFDLIGTRLELAVLEFNEQRERAKSALVLLLVAALFFAFAVIALTALIVVYYRDTHRLIALAAVTAAHLVIAVGALMRLKARESDSTAPCAQTMAEFQRDREWLAGNVRDEAADGRVE